MSTRTPNMTHSAPLKIAALAVAALALASCGQPAQPSEPVTFEEEVIIEPEVQPAEEHAAPVVAEVPHEDTVPNEALPPQVQSSEESVQPDSETLFY